MNDNETVIKIDLDAVVRERLPRQSRWIPRSLIACMERLICQDRLNWLLENNRGKKGADFCAGVLHDLNVTYNIIGDANLPSCDDSRVTYVSNHPLGALDGIAIIDMVARRHGRPVHFIVNDLLAAIKPLEQVFVPVNKHGCQSRKSTLEISRVFAGDDPVVVFPAGLVSRRVKGGRIHDLDWHKMFVNKSIESGRDIIPMFFSGSNSSFFYNFAKFRTKIGLKFNFEMVLLPREVFRCENAVFDIHVGQRIPRDTLRGGRDAEACAREICRQVYSLGGQ